MQAARLISVTTLAIWVCKFKLAAGYCKINGQDDNSNGYILSTFAVLIEMNVAAPRMEDDTLICHGLVHQTHLLPHSSPSPCTSAALALVQSLGHFFSMIKSDHTVPYVWNIVISLPPCTWVTHIYPSWTSSISFLPKCHFHSLYLHLTHSPSTIYLSFRIFMAAAIFFS